MNKNTALLGVLPRQRKAENVWITNAKAVVIENDNWKFPVLENFRTRGEAEAFIRRIRNE